MTHNNEGQITERMNSLVGELAGLDPKDPGRAEIIKEPSQLSLLSAYAKKGQKKIATAHSNSICSRSKASAVATAGLELATVDTVGNRHRHRAYGRGVDGERPAVFVRSRWASFYC